MFFWEMFFWVYCLFLSYGFGLFVVLLRFFGFLCFLDNNFLLDLYCISNFIYFVGCFFNLFIILFVIYKWFCFLLNFDNGGNYKLGKVGGVMWGLNNGF